MNWTSYLVFSWYSMILDIHIHHFEGWCSSSILWVIFFVILVVICCFIIFDLFKNLNNLFINNIYIFFDAITVSIHFQPYGIIDFLGGRVKIKVFSQAVCSGVSINFWLWCIQRNHLQSITRFAALGIDHRLVLSRYGRTPHQVVDFLISIRRYNVWFYLTVFIPINISLLLVLWPNYVNNFNGIENCCFTTKLKTLTSAWLFLSLFKILFMTSVNIK